jgi:hypothetical protein
MNDEQLTPEQDRKILELFEEAALHDYPNPDRIGCPGLDFLQRLATDRRSISLSDPALDHVATCSPCFREFAGYRHRAKRARMTRRAAIAAGGAILIAGATAIVGSLINRSKPSEFIADDFEPAEFNMFNDSPERGVSNSEQQSLPSKDLPRKRLNLLLTLPFASPEGNYEVQVVGPNGATRLKASGPARLVNGKTLLRVRLDLTKLQPDTYKLGIRRIPYDWTSQPVKIR